MLLRRPLALLLLVGLAALLALASPAPAAKGKRALRAFSDCRELVRYGTRHAGRYAPGTPPAATPAPQPMPPTGAPGPGAAPAAPVGAPENEAPDTSGTNTQEAGVGEPDTVKTDGRTVFAIAGGRLRIVDVTGRAPVLLRTLDVGAGHDSSMFLRHGRLLVLSSEWAHATAASSPSVAPAPGSPRTVMTLVDVRDPAQPTVVQRLTVDGWLVAARRTGDLARMVLSGTPPAIADPAAQDDRPAAWLPRATLASARRPAAARTRRAVGCRAVRRPRVFAGLQTTTVLTLDWTAGLTPVDADTVLGGGETVYASPGSLYVATRRYVRDLVTRTDGPVPELTTDLHRFAAGATPETGYRGSGRVPGFLLNQFAVSEHDGVLRVASTDEPPWFSSPEAGEPSQSFVTTLRIADEGLQPLGQVGGLGRGERIHGVRFIGDMGYVVTFRQTDPLYTVDLADPARPRVRGELKILGYSAYLHPAGDGRLIGVGQDATEQGRRLGVQVSLFDVSDAAAPRVLQRRTLGSSSSTDVEWDHHAFLWWPKADLVVIPVTTWDTERFAGAVGFTVRDGGIAEAGRVAHADPGGWAAPITRSLVVGDRLLTLSAAGLAAHTLDGFAPFGYAAFE